MIIHSKPYAFGSDLVEWNPRGSVLAGKPRPEKPKEEEKPEFISEEEFKV